MNLCIVLEARFVKDAYGDVYYLDSGYDHSLWNRYLSCYDKLFVVARVLDDPTYQPNGKQKSNSHRVVFIEMPYYIGILGMLSHIFTTINKIYLVIKSHQKTAFICRVPGLLTNIFAYFLYLYGKPYGVEVVGDPAEVFGKNGVQHPLRRLVRFISRHLTLFTVSKAYSAIYVTKKYLQERYPVGRNAQSFAASDVVIAKSVISLYPKKFLYKDKYTVVSVGSLHQMYKSPDVFVDAAFILKNEYHINGDFIWLGDGLYRSLVEDMVSKKDLHGTVQLAGNVSSSEVFQILDTADIFVLVSKTEGMPRAMIEAMAVGLPCIGTNVGGIPELLHEEALVDVNDSRQLADKIKSFILHQEVYNWHAERNLNEAHAYEESLLAHERQRFYKSLMI